MVLCAAAKCKRLLIAQGTWCSRSCTSLNKEKIWIPAQELESAATWQQGSASANAVQREITLASFQLSCSLRVQLGQRCITTKTLRLCLHCLASRVLRVSALTDVASCEGARVTVVWLAGDELNKVSRCERASRCSFRRRWPYCIAGQQSDD